MAILGIDEVGRGAWAGPLVVGACVVPDTIQIPGLNDSKLLTKAQRQVLVPIIEQAAAAQSLGWVSAAELDRIGLAGALRLATQRALWGIPESCYSKIIIDGTQDFLDSPLVTVMKQADRLVPSVSAASILAKVARDQFMAKLDQDPKYQIYQFARHVGYGTLLHRELLANFGVCDQHRQSFKPIAKLLGNYQSATSKRCGDLGEDLACRYLKRLGYEILARNWRTKIFEIDVVASKSDTIYLIEVKTRKNLDFGGGWAAITATKIAKMRRAAHFLTSVERFFGQDVKLAVINIVAAQVSPEGLVEI